MSYSIQFDDVFHVSREMPGGVLVEISNKEYRLITADIKRLKGDATGKITIPVQSVSFSEGAAPSAEVVVATLVYSNTHIHLQGYMDSDMHPWCSGSVPLSGLTERVEPHMCEA